MKYSRIMGTGSYLPPNVMTNHDLSQMVDTSHEWIVERTGIHQRHCAQDETCCDLAEKAARQALERAGRSPQDVDLIIVATCSGDLVFPSTACLLQGRLGAKPGGIAFDIQAACSGFIYALDLADKFIRNGQCRSALIIGSEVMTRLLDWNDRTTCVLFGDGAGAVLLEPSDEPGILSTHIHADGRYEHLLSVNCGISNRSDLLKTVGPVIQMRGNEVFRAAVQLLGQIVEETLDANHMSYDDVDWLIPHQANIRIIKATAKKLKLPMDRVIVTVDKHGNTSAASIPLALDEAITSNRLKRGETLLLEAFGGGFTWGSALLNY